MLDAVAVNQAIVTSAQISSIRSSLMRKQNSLLKQVNRYILEKIHRSSVRTR